MSARRAARRAKVKQRRTQPRGWFRRRWSAGAVAAVLAFAALALVLFWPRGPVYAEYVDGRRPTVVFVWADPTPDHPGG